MSTALTPRAATLALAAGMLAAALAATGCEQMKKAEAEAARAAKKAEEALKPVQEAARATQEVITDAAEVLAAIRELVPVNVDRSAAAAEKRWKSVLGVSVPERYRGALIADVELPGALKIELTSIIPQKASTALVFAPKSASLRIASGRHTVMVGADVPGGDPRVIRRAIGVLSEDGDGPVEKKTLTLGKAKVPYYEQRLKKDLAQFFFLSNGRVLHAVGPQKGFDHQAVKSVVGRLAKAHPNDPLLVELPAP